MENVLLCEFKKKDFEDFMRPRPDLVFRITKLIGLRLQKMGSRVVDLICKDVTTRIAELLLNLSDQHGKAVGGSAERRIKLTHQELALGRGLPANHDRDS
jgi:CRP-like cAMP-binding protein